MIEENTCRLGAFALFRWQVPPVMVVGLVKYPCYKHTYRKSNVLFAPTANYLPLFTFDQTAYLIWLLLTCIIHAGSCGCSIELKFDTLAL